VFDNVRQTITVYRCGRAVAVPAELHQHLLHVLRERWEARFPSSGKRGLRDPTVASGEKYGKLPWPLGPRP
jgi:hypothetical protein